MAADYPGLRRSGHEKKNLSQRSSKDEISGLPQVMFFGILITFAKVFILYGQIGNPVGFFKIGYDFGDLDNFCKNVGDLDR